MRHIRPLIVATLIAAFFGIGFGSNSTEAPSHTPITVTASQQQQARTDYYIPAEGYGSHAKEDGTLYFAVIPHNPSDPIALTVAVPDESPDGGYPTEVYEDGSTLYSDGWKLDPDTANGPMFVHPDYNPGGGAVCGTDAQCAAYSQKTGV